VLRFNAYRWLPISVILLPSLALVPIKNAGIVQEHDLPGAMKVHEKRVVTWSLDIYDCEGFARFQVQFPKGIDAKPVETANASFSFEDGKAKFIWMELPPKNTLVVSLEITANDIFQGGSVTQWFSFIRDGRRKDVEFEPHHLALEEISITNSTDSPVELQVQRRWTETTRRSGTMTVTISGYEAGQFLKLTEVVGPHDAVSILEDSGCEIRDAFDNQLVFIWQAAPRGAEMVVQYTLRGGQPLAVTGYVSTIQKNVPSEHNIGAVVSSSTEEEFTENSAKPDAPTPEPELESLEIDVAFRIQILATHSAISTEAVKRIYAYPGDVRSERKAEWYKFTTGYHPSYQSARNDRVDLSTNHSFPGPFVTAYRNGQRITVQEALLVTKQNWIP